MSGVGLVAVSLAGMVLGCVVVGGLGQVALARAQADTAADLAALAVAARTVRGEPAATACPVGEVVAQQDGARLVGCRVTATVVTVVVELDLEVLGLRAEVSARARAGPAVAG